MTEQFTTLDFERLDAQVMLKNSEEFLASISKRRTVRDFSDRAVNPEIILNAIKTAASAPSGANKQPWHFAMISNPAVKREIRLAAEAEEREFYQNRATDEWLEDLAPLGTDANKPFLERAPYLIPVFLQKFTIDDNNIKHKHYYTPESVGIACGFLLAALHTAGLVTLTHTPSPMKFLNKICKRPEHERPFMLIVAGYPDDDAMVPNITKKPTNNIVTRIE